MMTKRAGRNWRPGRDSLIEIEGRQAYRVDVSSSAYPDTYTIVDPDVYETLMHMVKWTVTRGAVGGLYVRRNFGTKSVRLHRLITGAEAGQHVDHINGDPLDNRMANLRVCLPRQNSSNSRSSTGASKYKGVAPVNGSRISPWRAQICVARKSIYLGSYKTEEEAALAYNAAALKHFGEYALLNCVASRPLDSSSCTDEALTSLRED